MGITRRQFTGAAWRLGLAGAGGGLLGSCGGSDDEPAAPPPPAPPTTEAKTIHFDLSAVPAADPHVLRAGGKRYALKPHDGPSRRLARIARPGLARVPDSHLTHYADGVVLSLTRQQRMHVTTTSPTRGHGLALVAMHIPTASRIAARRTRGMGAEACSGLCGSGDICTFSDQVEDDFVSGRSTAKAIITHYPDVMNPDGSVAAQVETHMDGDQSAVVDAFTLILCNQGPAYEHDDNYVDGWAVLVPRLQADGTAILDGEGNPTFDYVYTDDTEAGLAQAVPPIVQSIKNDPTLDGKQYQVIYHGDAVDTGSLPAANPTPLVGGSPASLAAPQGSTSEVTFSTLGYLHNILFYGDQGSAASRQFSLNILNLNYIWYGLYIEYLDAGGRALPAQGSGALDSVLQWAAIETDTLVFWDMISSPPAIFGIPAPFPYRVSLTLPAGASSARLSLVGPGGYGNVPWGPAVIPGIVLTTVIQYMLPMFFLASGTGIDSTARLIDLVLDKPSIWVKTLSEAMQILSGATGSNTNDYGLEGSVESLLAAVVQNLLLVPMERLSPEMWEWITETFTEEEIADGVPFVGWIVRAVAIAGTVGAMVATTAEIGSNPIVISNTVSFKHSVQFVISHDPNDAGFPLTATHCVVLVTAGTTTLWPGTVVQIPQSPPPSLSVTIDGIPATGASATVSVVFQSATNFIVAHSATVDVNGALVLDASGKPVAGDVSFQNIAPTDGSVLTVAVPIIENPVPITAQTVYTHHHKLSYTAGRYGWTYTSQPAPIEAAVCSNANGLCRPGNVAVWLPGGMIGASWLGTSPTVRSCVTGAAGQLYDFRNVSLLSDPNGGYKAPGCGFPAAAPLAYDMSAQAGSNGWHFYLDVVDVGASSPESHLRRIVLDATTPIAAPSTQSWGRFRIPVDRIAVYGKGLAPRVVGISTHAHKLAVLELPQAAFSGDAFANNAKVLSGQGDQSDALLISPSALTIADNGAVLVLQGGATKSVKAFDFDGKPWKFFFTETKSELPLPQDAASVTWLDISIEPTNLLYVLSHTGAGTQQSDYRLDVYDTATGQRIVRNTGIGVAAIVVDRFRALYTLNYETVKGAPGIEPSVSVWAPSTP